MSKIIILLTLIFSIFSVILFSYQITLKNQISDLRGALVASSQIDLSTFIYLKNNKEDVVFDRIGENLVLKIEVLHRLNPKDFDLAYIVGNLSEENDFHFLINESKGLIKYIDIYQNDPNMRSNFRRAKDEIESYLPGLKSMDPPVESSP